MEDGGRNPPIFLLMPGLTIPDDWSNNEYCWLVARIPNSNRWIGLARGAIYSLSLWYKFDKKSGDQDAAAGIGSDIYDSIEIKKALGMELQFNAQRATNQSVADGSKLRFDVSDYNLNGQWDTVNYEWTVPADGLYLVKTFLQIKGMSSGNAAIAVWGKLNGTDDILYSGDQVNSGSATDWVYCSSERYKHLSQGDAVSFYAWQSEAPTSRNTTDPADCMVTVFKVN